MLRVLVVDDEPGAMQHICSIIKMKCPDYTVVGTAENGEEGLKWFQENEAELVITDVQMPRMNGIEMVTAINKLYPEVMSIVVSGYQEFEYAQGALKAGSADYILKPVVPSEMCRTMDRVAQKLKVKKYYEKNAVIHEMCSGEAVDRKTILKSFPYSRYYGAVIRRNGLPKRFSGSSGLEIYSDINEMVTIYGRDEMEELYLLPEELLLEENFKDFIFRIRDKYSSDNQYVTLVYKEETFSALEIQNIVLGLYRMLDSVSVVGLTQAVKMQGHFQKKEADIDQEAVNSVLKNIEFLVQEQQYERVKKEIRRVFQSWEAEKKPQIWMEYFARQVIFLIRNCSKKAPALIECEYMMEDAFYYSVSVEELLENLFDIMFKYTKEPEEINKVDSPEFFGMIKDFIYSNMSEQITLQSVCKKFAVSQTYLSKLFRKYEQQSFNRYLTDIRIKKAMDLMKNNGEIYIKDIAAMVGYSDQFYFSRIFRSCTGKCPSEYLEEL